MFVLKNFLISTKFLRHINNNIILKTMPNKRKKAEPVDEAESPQKRRLRSTKTNVADKEPKFKIKNIDDADGEKNPKTSEKKPKTLEKKPKTSEKKPNTLEKTPKTPEKKPKTSEKKIVSASNGSGTDWDSIVFSIDKTNRLGSQYNTKITSWNVAGVRAWLKKDGLNIFKYSNADIICLQEMKCSDDKLPDEMKEVDGYHRYTCSSVKPGYAGVAVYSKKEAIDALYGIGDTEHDKDGRCITAEYEKFYVVCVYVPNAGRGLVTLDKRLEWNELFKKFIKSLDKRKPVIIAGDMNVAHNEIDLKNPSSNKKNAGFTPQEREGMTDFLSDGYVDTFRHLYPDQKDAYTFWSYMGNARSKNVGWRLDYFTVSNRLMDHVCDCVIHKDVYGSDHCPLTLFLNI